MLQGNQVKKKKVQKVSYLGKKGISFWDVIYFLEKEQSLVYELIICCFLFQQLV